MISIENVDFRGFGDLFDERLDLSESVLNLLEESEAKRTLLPAAILAVLFGFDQDAQLAPDFNDLCDIAKFRPSKESSGQFVASLLIKRDGQKIKIIRDFNNNQVTILECGETETDITSQFTVGKNEPGLTLTALNKEEFGARCFFISESSISESAKTDRLFQIMSNIIAANSASCKGAESILVLDKVLTQYPYKSDNVLVKIQVNFFLEELKKQALKLQQRITEYDQQRAALSLKFGEIDKIDAKLANPNQKTEAAEYFTLCLRAAEIDSLVLQLRSNSIRINRIEQELIRIGPMQGFQIELQDELEDLWARRSSLLSDSKLESEFALQMQDYEKEESAVRQRWQGLQSFSQEQTSTLLKLSNDFINAEHNILARSNIEKESMKAANLDPIKVDKIRESLRRLGKSRAEEAKSYTVLVAMFARQLAQTERSRTRAEIHIKETEDEQHDQKTPSGVLKIFKSGSAQKQLETAKRDFETQQKGVALLRNKIGTLEKLLDDIAVTAQTGNGYQLMQESQTFIELEEQLKQTERNEEAITDQCREIDDLKASLAPYFLQGGRKQVEITSITAKQLAEDVSHCLNDLDALNELFASIQANRARLNAWLSAMADNEKLLEQVFVRSLPEELTAASSDSKIDIDACYTEFYGTVAKYHHSKSLRDDLAKIQDKTAMAIGDENIYSAIVKFEQERQNAWQRIHELVDQFPEISEVSPPSNKAELAKLVEVDTDRLNNLQSERDKLKEEIANFFSDYDRHYLDLLETLGKVKRELNAVRTNKVALELSRSILDNILEEDMSASFPIDQIGAESLPLIVDAAYLEQEELGLFLSLKLLARLLKSHRQVIIINTNRTLNLTKFSLLEFKRAKRMLAP